MENEVFTRFLNILFRLGLFEFVDNYKCLKIWGVDSNNLVVSA